MQFSTQVPLQPYAHPIHYESKIVSFGSCFAENIGEKFSYFQFQSHVNPFGIIFNPVSLQKILSRVVYKTYFTATDLFFHNEAWHCFEVHSEASHIDQDLMLQHLNQTLEQSHQQLLVASHIIITLGTAWVYENKSSNSVVANCHKVPQQQFHKQLLTPEVIHESLQQIIHEVHSLNSQVQFLFTVSPVRHIKDGFVQNQISKAHLITAVHQLLGQAENQQKTAYFPSYEIMMDELRDYRFYGPDLLHPNNIAIDYIWERFIEAMISPEALPTIDTVASIRKGKLHRAFNPNSESHQKFLAHLSQKINTLVVQFPHMTF